MNDIDIELIAVSKTFGPISVVTDIDLQIPKGEFVSILGPSGCGKTTTLNMIAGFNQPSRGEIQIRGKSQAQVPPERRNIGLVFQNYALFPHMTVAENVAFGLKMKGMAKAEIETIVSSALRSVHLDQLSGRYPKALSGGQQQRVALARALAPRPSVLLLDEPLSNLDLKLRESMRAELKDIQRELGMTFVYVTHDQEEAMAMSDRIVVMWKGEIAQQGEPGSIYRHPVSTFVANFIGKSNIVEIKTVSSHSHGSEVRLHGTDLTLRAADRSRSSHIRYAVIRPEDILVIGKKQADSVAEGRNVMTGLLRRVTNLGPSLELLIEVNPALSLSVLLRSAEASGLPGLGEAIMIAIDPASVTLLSD